MKAERNSIIWRVITLVLVITVGLFSLVLPVKAAEINNKGIVTADETINDDLVLSSDTVRMDGTVNGLLMAVGNDVVISGTVNGDLIAVGRTITVKENAVIDGNIFTGAQNVTINGKVTESVFGASMSMVNGPSSSIGRNQYYGGYSLSQSAGSSTGKDIRAGVYQAILEGEINQDAIVYGEAVEVSGKIGRNAEFIVGTPGDQVNTMPPTMQNMGVTRNLQPGLRIDPVAVIGGMLTYTSKVNQSGSIEATPAGGIVFLTPVPSQAETQKAGESAATAQVTGFISGFTGFASNLLSLLLIGGLILWKLPGLLNQHVDMLKSKPWPSTGYGFVTIIVGYAAVFLGLFLIIAIGLIIGFLTIGGLGGITIALGLSGLATVFSLFSLAISHISKVIVAYLVGQWLFGKLAPNQSNAIWPLIIGVLVYAILRAIPFVGVFFGIAAAILGIGAMWLVFREKTTRTTQVIPQ